MPECVHCGGSGILNIEYVGPSLDDLHSCEYATACHACEMGAVMAEAGVDA